MGERLHGRRILVAGGSAGIGRSVASQCVAEGARVACIARDRHRLQAAADGMGALALPADIMDTGAVTDAVATAVDEFGGIDGLVNCAAGYRLGGVGDTSVADWRHMFDVNVLGLLNVTKAALPSLCAAGRADVVNLSSMGGRRVAGADSGVYSGTKFAVHAISEGLRREYHDRGVRICVVSPGAVATELGLADASPPEAERIREHRRRIGLSPDDVAAQVIHALAQPAGVTLQEIALTSTAQPPG